MTDKTMTLDALRDWHAEGANACSDRGDEAGYIFHSEAADAITRHLSKPAERGEAQDKAEPVAVIGPVWQLLWCDSESIAAIAKKHGLKVGDKLYAAPPAERERVPDGWKLVPERIVIEADAWENAQFAFGGPGTGEGESYTDCTLWIGDIDEDDGSKTHGLHLSCNEVPEEGSVTLAKFSAAPEADHD